MVVLKNILLGETVLNACNVNGAASASLHPPPLLPLLSPSSSVILRTGSTEHYIRIFLKQPYFGENRFSVNYN